VNEERVGLKHFDVHRQRARVERFAKFEHVFPARFILARRWAVQNSDIVAARGKFGRSNKYVGLGASQRSESFVNIEKLQTTVSLRNAAREGNQANPQRRSKNRPFEKRVQPD
jgi:hypothetical protein